MRLGKLFSAFSLIFVISGCANLVSSAVESGIVYIVAKHDETVEKKQKKYTATDRCVVKGEPDAVLTGNMIAYGQPITMKYDKILSRTGEDIPPVEPHQLAYAFYIIADEINDNRGKERMAWIEHQMNPEDASEIRSIINDKYLVSHLEKCFSVPESYRIAKTTRQMIKEEQAELEEMNRK